MVGKVSKKKLNSAAAEVVVYSTPNCKYCVEAKKFFTLKGKKFREVSIQDNPFEFMAFMERTGSMGAPIIQIGDEIIRGWNKKKVESLI